MKLLQVNAPANSPTCCVREADANLLNLFPQLSPYLSQIAQFQAHRIFYFFPIEGNRWFFHCSGHKKRGFSPDRMKSYCASCGFLER